MKYVHNLKQLNLMPYRDTQLEKEKEQERIRKEIAKLKRRNKFNKFQKKKEKKVKEKVKKIAYIGHDGSKWVDPPENEDEQKNDGISSDDDDSDQSDKYHVIDLRNFDPNYKFDRKPLNLAEFKRRYNEIQSAVNEKPRHSNHQLLLSPKRQTNLKALTNKDVEDLNNALA